METKELGLTLTIGFIAVTALGTRSTRISRVNKVDGYASLLCLVSDKAFQLVKSPIAHLPSHFPIKTVGPLSDIFKVFQSECLAGKKCRLHKLFTDNVIDVLAKARGFQSYLLQGASCPLRAALLQATTVGADASAQSLDCCARIGMALAIRRKLYYAEVNSKYAVGFDKQRVWNADRCHQVEVAIDKSKVSFALTESKKPTLIRPAHKGQFNPSVNRPDRNLPFVDVPFENTVIKGNCACRLKCALSALVQLIGVGYLTNAPDNYLRGKPGGSPLCRILTFVERELTKYLIVPNPRAQAVTHSVCGNHSALQGIRLVRSNDQFHLCSKFQRIDIMPAFTRGRQCQSNLLGQFLPRIDAEGVSLPTYTKGLL